LDAPVAAGPDRLAVLRLDDLDLQVPLATELFDRPFGHVRRERLAVPAVLVGDLAEAAALDGLGNDHGRLPGGVPGRAQRPVDLGHVMAVDDDRVAAIRLNPLPVDVDLPAVLGLAPLTQPVNVEDR